MRGSASFLVDPIEAEAQALLLGAKLERALNLQDVNFVTDNEVLARAAQAGSPRFHPGHWSIRPTLALLAEATQGMKHSIIKIRRESNGVADRLAKQVRLAAIQSPCLFSCQAIVHSPRACLVARNWRRRNHCTALCCTVAFRFYLVKIVQTLTN
jgi:hypothetical protein